MSISCIPCIELIVTTNVGEPWLGNKMIKKCKVKVTGHGENIGNAYLYKPACKVTTRVLALGRARA
jgi:hypothetical protein